jgi:hypothetical protein
VKESDLRDYADVEENSRFLMSFKNVDEMTNDEFRVKYDPQLKKEAR